MRRNYEKIHLAIIEAIVCRGLKGKVTNEVLFRWTRLALGQEVDDSILGRAADALALKSWRTRFKRGRIIDDRNIAAFNGAMDYLILKQQARQEQRVFHPASPASF